jgi:hypothetical protein
MSFGKLFLILIAALIGTELMCAPVRADECRDAVEASNAFIAKAFKRSARTVEEATFGSAQAQCDELRRRIADLEQELQNSRRVRQVCGARYIPAKCDEACQSAGLERQRKDADAVCEKARQPERFMQEDAATEQKEKEARSRSQGCMKAVAFLLLGTKDLTADQRQELDVSIVDCGAKADRNDCEHAVATIKQIGESVPATLVCKGP